MSEDSIIHLSLDLQVKHYYITKDSIARLNIDVCVRRWLTEVAKDSEVLRFDDLMGYYNRKKEENA